jgi:hypothetical protein
MKANIELALRTREVYQLFERKLKKNRLFIDAIQHRINKLINLSKQQCKQSTTVLEQLKDKLTSLTTYFLAEITRFNVLLNQNKVLEGKSIQYVIQFRPTIILYNHLSPLLVKFLECYDHLIATLKLLRLAGCFCSEIDYFHTVKQYQKMANQLLSSLLIINNPLDHKRLKIL